MRPSSKRSFVMIFVMAAALAGCAGGGRIKTLSVRSGKLDILPIQAGRFHFWPNEIRVDKPGPLSIAIKNVSGSQQNFTLKDPKYNTLESVDLPPGETTIINVNFPMPGVYQFFSNRPLHSFFGMNGQISVGE